MIETGILDGQPGLPVGGCQTCIGLHLAGLLLLDGGLVDGVLQEALPGHGAGFAVPHSFRAAAGLHWGGCERLVLLHSSDIVSGNNLCHV